MSGLVLTEVSGPIATLTLNRPERHNSLVPELLEDMLTALRDVREQPDLRALVLQANGRSFSTGGDVRAFYEAADAVAYAQRLVGLLNQTVLELIDFPAPIVAAVHGIVTGGSIGLVLAADVVLVAPSASFTPYYTTVGFSPDGGWTAVLPAVIGQHRAAGALLLDQPISAEQAVAWGLANQLVPADQIHAQARAVALVLTERAPGSLRRTRQLLWGNADIIAERLEAERRQFVAQIATTEAQNGMAAFLERRQRRQNQ